MDICYHRPLIVTACRKDISIRVWNYHQMRCDLKKQFDASNFESTDPQPLICVSIHPNGYYLASGFVDKIRIFHLTYNDLKAYREIGLKNCNQIRFSNGGNYLACAAKTKSNNFDIYVYNSNTMELIETLKANN